MEAVASDVTQWTIGQQVYGFAQTGAFAEKMVVSAFTLRAVPPRMSLKEVDLSQHHSFSKSLIFKASGFSMTYPTSYAYVI